MTAAPLIEFRGVSKKFGNLYANREIRLEITPGEIHSLAGENGAGKTTLMNILFGKIRPDSGTIFLRGAPAKLRTPRDAILAGIAMVHQNLLYFPQLSVLENVVLGNEPSKAGFLGAREALREFLRLRDTFGFNLEPDTPAGDLPFAGRQQVELLRGLYRGADILILDEPTSFLGHHEVNKFLDLLKSLRAGGRTILFISHRLSEVFAIADRITVLRHGEVAATLKSSDTCPEEIARLMIGAGEGPADQHQARGRGHHEEHEPHEEKNKGGHEAHGARGTREHEGHKEYEIHAEKLATDSSQNIQPHVGQAFQPAAFHDPQASPAATSMPGSIALASGPLLEVRNLCIAPAAGETGIRNVSFSVQQGEIFGIGGIVGNGHRLLARTLSGRAFAESGAVFSDGLDITNMTIRERLQAGICRVPENPAEEALMRERPLWENFLLGRQRENRFQRGGKILKTQIVEFTADQVRENSIAAESPLQPLSSLSGGNAQKVALARTLSAQPKLVILEQPSRGLDLHASARIHNRIFELSRKGTAFVVFSYDLDELLSICSRVAVLFRGELKGPAAIDDVTREGLGRWMGGLE